MIASRTFLALVLASGVALACQSEPATETGEMAESETAAPVDVESLKAEFQASNDAWEAAATAGDAAALAALYTDDAILLVPDMPRADGQAEIQAAFEAMLAGATFDAMEIVADDVVVAESGELAYMVGHFRDAGTLADGTSFEDVGKFVAIHRLVDGEWKIAVDTWNSDPAPAAAEDAAM